MDYLQKALITFNGGMWYGWKTHDDKGDKIPGIVTGKPQKATWY